MYLTHEFTSPARTFNSETLHFFPPVSLPPFFFFKTQVNTKNKPGFQWPYNTQTFLLQCRNESDLTQSTHLQFKVQGKLTFELITFHLIK